MKTKKTAKQKADLLNKNKADYKKIGNRIKQLRLDAGYTAAEDFAHDNGIPRAQYARYEAGMNMTLSSLLTIVRCHNITLAEFFKD